MKVSNKDQENSIELKRKENIKVDETCVCPCDMNFKDIIGQPQSINGESSEFIACATPSDSILQPQDLKDIKSAFNYDTFSMDKDDAKFFVDMANSTGEFALNIQGSANSADILKVTEGTTNIQKSANVSKALVNMIEDAYNTQKPVRIDFDNNVSVIMKIDKNGKVSADFIPGDKAVEQYLRDNISFLKQRFDDEGLQYNQLSYRQSKNNNQNRKKENKGE